MWRFAAAPQLFICEFIIDCIAYVYLGWRYLDLDGTRNSAADFWQKPTAVD